MQSSNTLLRSRQILASTNMTCMLGLTRPMGSKAFSTIVPKVYSNAVFMPELFPARLTVPAGKLNYDFTCENNMKVADFRQQVLDNTNQDVKSFELLTVEKQKEADVDKMTMGELKQQKFRMRVNNRNFDVYPDMISIVKDPAQVTKHKKEMLKIEEMDNSIPICRQTILRDYYSTLVSLVKKEAGTGNKITKAKLDKAIKTSLQTYAESVQANSSRAEATLQALKEELAVQLQQKSDITRASHKKAGMFLGFGFMGCLTQLVGFYTGIYVVADWNEMEPWTWIFCKLQFYH